MLNQSTLSASTSEFWFGRLGWQHVGVNLFALMLSLPATAQPLGQQETLLQHFVGRWVLQGHIAGDDVLHTVNAKWILGRQYLQFNESTRRGKVDYEATVLIGWDTETSRYACLWLDSTGGSGLTNGIIGYAERNEQELAFAFASGSSTFHTTFSYDRATDSWRWTMDSEKPDGSMKPFARLAMHRMHFPSNDRQSDSEP